ncbi:hypothetical protein Lgra_3391 [Legionella gratiana]|uniref:Uncharacterized protein n=1 Tax=Legionella gratiana TaxID=45066 RepID=A0A378JDZ6_9GAMM|nr:hypothetical protein [Legionella gratiana]KTD05427.1 hypothetical protein Lgra_3391 [Legionella gratiana]STX46053.1 Uncharacterised protein [Legionella gratiana]
MFKKTEVLGDKSETNLASKSSIQNWSEIKKNSAQLELTDTGVPLNPHHFFSLKNMLKSQVKAPNFLPCEETDVSNELLVKRITVS